MGHQRWPTAGPAVVGHNWTIFHSTAGPALAVRDGAVMSASTGPVPGRRGMLKTNLDFTEARDSEWQWHLLGHMQVCISLQTDNHASTPPLVIFTGLMPFLPPNQQRQSTEGKANLNKPNIIFLTHFEQLVKCCLITVGIGRNLSLLHALPLPVNGAFSALRHIRLG